MKKYKPKIFREWCDELNPDEWFDMLENNIFNIEYEKYLTKYLREKKLKDISKKQVTTLNKLTTIIKRGPDCRC